MAAKKRRRKKQSYNSIFKNLILLSLFIIVFGFLGSMMQRILYNPDLDSISSSDLSKMIAATKYELKTGHKIEVEVKNGCGVPRLANMYTDFLRNEGYDVLDSGNADHFSYIESTILHHKGDFERALSLAKTMGINESLIINDDDDSKLHDVTLIIGRDYRNIYSHTDAILFLNPY